MKKIISLMLGISLLAGSGVLAGNVKGTSKTTKAASKSKGAQAMVSTKNAKPCRKWKNEICVAK